MFKNPILNIKKPKKSMINLFGFTTIVNAMTFSINFANSKYGMACISALCMIIFFRLYLLNRKKYKEELKDYEEKLQKEAKKDNLKKMEKEFNYRLKNF